MYTELGRTCVLGKASQEMKDEFAFVLEAREHTLKMLKPGASCKDIWESHNDFMRKNGKPEETRLYCHSQGYDMVERPLVRFDETMPLAANMVVAVHPTYVTSTTYSWACDNFLITDKGCERMHRFAEKITELDADPDDRIARILRGSAQDNRDGSDEIRRNGSSGFVEWTAAVATLRRPLASW